MIEDLPAYENANADVYADGAYRSKRITPHLEDKGLRDCLHRKGYRNRPLSERSREANRKKSKIRARVEHVFGRQYRFGERIMRCLGIARAQTWIGLRNPLYNPDRYARLAT